MSDTNDDEYRVATTFIKPGHENYDACRRLCFQSRVLHNVVVAQARLLCLSECQGARSQCQLLQVPYQ